MTRRPVSRVGLPTATPPDRMVVPVFRRGCRSGWSRPALGYRLRPPPAMAGGDSVNGDSTRIGRMVGLPELCRNVHFGPFFAACHCGARTAAINPSAMKTDN